MKEFQGQSRVENRQQELKEEGQKEDLGFEKKKGNAQKERKIIHRF